MADVSIPKRDRFKSAEVCSIAGLQPYILRSWEAEFPSLANGRTKSGARVYRRADVELVLQIKSLVFTDGLTLGAARRRLESAGGAQAADGAVDDVEYLDEPLPAEVQAQLATIKEGLRGILELLSGQAVTPPEAEQLALRGAADDTERPEDGAETKKSAPTKDKKEKAAARQAS